MTEQMKENAELLGLTEHQQRIAELLCSDTSQNAIAEMLGIKLKTLKWHALRIYKTAGVKSSKHLAIKLGEAKVTVTGHEYEALNLRVARLEAQLAALTLDKPYLSPGVVR